MGGVRLGAYLSLVRRGRGWGEGLFEAGRLSTFLPLGWPLIRGGHLFEVGRLFE